MELLRFYNKQTISHLRSPDKFTLTNFTHIHPTLLLHSWNNWFTKKHKTCVSFVKGKNIIFWKIRILLVVDVHWYCNEYVCSLVEKNDFRRSKYVPPDRFVSAATTCISLCPCTNWGNLKRYNLNSPRAKLNSLYSINFWLLVNVQSAAYWTNEQHLSLFL